MSELVTTRIRTTATKLGLPHLTEALTQHVDRADTGQLGYLDFLDLILEEELAVREERRFRHALRLSRLPHYKTIRACRTTRRSRSTTSPASPTWTPGRSRTWPPSRSSRSTATLF